MCITSGKAILQDTIVGAWDIEHPKYGYRHVLAYQNVPTNKEHRPNCMLLHVQSKNPLTPENIVDTSKCPNFLKTMVKGVEKIKNGGFLPRVFERNYILKMGIYHIAILNDVSKAEEALQTIPKEKRPNISKRFFRFFQEKFPNYPLLLCCFNNQESAKASPIMVHFEPIRPDVLMFNTLDSHGDIPNIGEDIQFHQTLVWGSYKAKEGIDEIVKFDLSGVSDEVRPFVCEYGYSDPLVYQLPNTDVLIGIEDILDGGDLTPVFQTLPKFVDFNHPSAYEYE